ncbi:class I SAM-dependent methyltransferase [Azohydromonas caseinilytica]|uniref:Class I SAM-dependent methyltransferase n=1 Tax=Azohydromonas caseinilytica TaxID=2728836 RepID=A0A848FKX1_9BURK|nr:class I SAM-dependent methyltransferase [Azohydromonas caseinilytica]NML18989.1 class I SAM-dependent methyltransferase [Azohydromonas caseinilytica]
MLNVRILTEKVARVLAEEGIAPLCRRALSHLRGQRERDPFDVENGTETSGLEPLWKLSIDSPNARHGERYQATSPQELVSVLEYLGVDPASSTFIDLGCGKGRTLIVAARFGFGKVIGVEFAQELAATAQANLVSQRLDNAVVLRADAAEFTFPPGSKVIYLYNPFSEQVLAKVLDNLRAFRNDRLYVVYKSPRCARLLDECDFLQRHERAPRAPHIGIWRGVTAEARVTPEAVA